MRDWTLISGKFTKKKTYNMADFCTKCALDLFGDEIAPDIDVQKEFETLRAGYVINGLLCEGCGLVTIGKTEENELRVMRLRDDEETLEWEEY
jgi:hypothetical protein